jgi:uncharacterized membrane protein YkoI
MSRRITKLGASVAVLAAVAVGAAAIAGAASNTSTSTSTSAAPAARAQPPGNGARPQHKPETPLTGDTAAKVKQAALAKVSGGTIIRVETDSDHGSPYEAHVRKSDGSEVEVLVNKQFEVTAVNAFGGPGGGPGAPGGAGA